MAAWRRAVMKHVLGVLALFLAVLLSLPAAAEDLVVSRGALEDPAGTLSISDVAGREFAPLDNLLSAGFTKSVHWLRVEVRAPVAGGDVVLYIRQSFLSDIRLYEADASDPSGWRMRVTGSHHPYAERGRPGMSLGFVVHVPAPGATYYLRLKTRSTSEMSVEAFSPEEAMQRDHWLDLMEVFFVTSMLALLLWAVHNYLVDRSAVVGLFVLHQTVYTLFGVAATGYLAPLAPAGYPEFLDGVTAALYCGIGLTAVLFCRALFKPYQPPPLLMRGFDVFLLAAPVELAAAALGQLTIALIVGFVVISVTWWYFVLVAFCLRREQTPSRRVVRVFFVILTLANNVHWLAHFWGPTNPGILSGWHILVADGLIVGSLFALMVHARLRLLHEQQVRATLDLVLARKTLEVERTLKEEAEVQARTDPLTGLFNRRHFLALAERELARAVRYDRPLALLMIDIDHFKAVNDTRGHAAGDAVIREVTRLIRAGLRDADVAGRIGGEEFAAVLAETDGEQAMQVAQRLCLTVAATPVPAPDGPPLRVTVSVGLSERRDRDPELDRLLREADQALYRAKQTGRNRVVGVA